MITWIDITRPLTPGMRVYSDAEAFSRDEVATIGDDGYNLSLLHMGAHTGTHMDAPAHFLEGGATIDEVPIDLLSGDALVLTALGGFDFDRLPGHVTRLLLRGEGFSGLAEAQARALVDKGIRLLGTDRLSPAPEENEAAIHRLLMRGGVWLLENLALDGVQDGWYRLNCLPLLIPGCEAAPARTLIGRVV